MAHNDLEKIFEWIELEIPINQLIADFKKICTVCSEVTADCFGGVFKSSYEIYFNDMISSLKALILKES